jgi:hypothetical protein
MNKKHLWWALAGIGGAAALGALLWGPIASRVERARYKVVARDRDIEIRDYAPMIVAETELSADREQAIQHGFRRLADYIFGNNTGGRVVAMTAPVTQQGEAENWRVRFMMPGRHTMETLPQPNNPAVMLKTIEGKYIAAIRFSGTARDARLRHHTERLEAFIRDNGLRPLSPPAYAFYNPPWTPPFFRRNEVMIEIAG